MSWVTLASGADIDGDGVDDSVDDCIYAAGNSTVDRTGCPDRDGDGTSDFNDGWTSSNPNFAKDVFFDFSIAPIKFFDDLSPNLSSDNRFCSVIEKIELIESSNPSSTS